jgi:hypothetical protein
MNLYCHCRPDGDRENKRERDLKAGATSRVSNERQVQLSPVLLTMDQDREEAGLFVLSHAPPHGRERERRISLASKSSPEG